MIWLWLLACGEEVQEVQEKKLDIRARVRTYEAQKKDFGEIYRFPAKIHAFHHAVLFPKSMGRIAQVNFRVGAQVEEGDLLLEIENFDYLTGYREAQVGYQITETQFKHAKTQYERFSVLHEQGAATQLQLEEVRMGMELADGQKKRASAGVEIARSRVEGCKLYAPFSGTLIARNVEPGELLGSAGQRPPLMLADLSKVRIKAEISEESAQKIRIGDQADLIQPNGIRHPLTIDSINAAVDPVVHTVSVEAILEKPGFRHGASVEIEIATQKEQYISIPRVALLEANKGRGHVFILEGEDKIKKSEVLYGRSDTEYIPIFEGINEGDAVLIAGHTRLKPEDSVLVVKE